MRFSPFVYASFFHPPRHRGALPSRAASQKLIEKIRTQWWLVNVVDNDFVGGDIAAFIEAVMAVDETKVHTLKRDLFNHTHQAMLENFSIYH